MTTHDSNNSTPVNKSKFTAGKDFVYEYSDLNILQTRIKILKGKYRGLVVEIGDSVFTEYNTNSCDLDFQYTPYVIPATLIVDTQEKLQDLKNHLSSLLIAIIQDRSQDPIGLEKLYEVAIAPPPCTIKIPKKFYEKL